MELLEFIGFHGLGTENNLSYLPQPNVADVVLTNRIAPLDLIPTSMVFPFLPDGRAILAQNRRRGAEIPGGHRDVIDGVLEDPEVAARREAYEEAGVIVPVLKPVGFMRSTINGEVSVNYRYPYPHSAQQFYTGIVEQMIDYVENDECLSPLILAPDQVADHLRGRALILFEEARIVAFK